MPWLYVWVRICYRRVFDAADCKSVGTVVADLLLTGFMMVRSVAPVFFSLFPRPEAESQYGLSKNKTGWSHTDQFINRLIRTAIETQLPGTIVSAYCVHRHSPVPPFATARRPLVG